MLIALEGIDRSGKSTQCALLQEFLARRNKKATALRYPDRNAPYTGPLIAQYLTREVELTPPTASLVLSAALWTTAATIRSLQAADADQIVVVDRYTWTSIAYSTQRGMPQGMMEKICEGLPIPDLIVYLEGVAEATAQREGFGRERFDQTDFQRGVGAIMSELAARSPCPVLVVPSTGTIEDIHQTIVDHLRLRLAP